MVSNCAPFDGALAPNRPEPEFVEPDTCPNKPPAGWLELLPRGGGPAGVVEPKLNVGLTGAGVIEPDADVVALLDGVLNRPEDCLFRFEKSPPAWVLLVGLLSAVEAVGVAFSSFFGVKLKGEVEAAVLLNRLEVVVAGF